MDTPVERKITIGVPQDLEGCPKLEGMLGRVNIILGTNGSGKSKLLQYIKTNSTGLGGTTSTVYVEGGRVVAPPESVELDKSTIGTSNTVTNARASHSSRRVSGLSNRAREAFLLLERMGDQIKLAHSDATDGWLRGGKSGEPPGRDEPPLDKLFGMFSKLFPHIQITRDQESKKIWCHKNGQKYPPSKLSDGERQVLVLLADVALLSEPTSLVVVDEPELNLHPQLSCDVWNLIEGERPNSIFMDLLDIWGLSLV